MREKLTIQDIARVAGVSKATVSRVLNNNPSVAPAIAERVMSVVQQYNFVPNVIATGLAGGHTRLIGVLAPSLTWPAVPEIMHGVAEYIERTSYEIVLYSIGLGRNHTDVLDHILSMRMVAGLIAILPGKISRHLTDLFQQGLPLVMIDDQEKPAELPWVGIDNISSAYKATHHLIELGHKRIAHISGPHHYDCAVERYQGYCQALEDAGIPVDPELFVEGTFEPASGRQCATTVFSRERDQWPTAIFVANDQMAYGVLEIAEQQGIRIPDDISIVGFDDNSFSARVRPSLTTIQQPFTAMGQQACEILLTMIEADRRIEKKRRHPVSPITRLRPKEGTKEDPVRIYLPTSLVIRASSGVPQVVLPYQ